MKKCYYWWKSKTIKRWFTFDMGPSWYWMPDVFDRFFFGKRQPIIMSSSSYLLLIEYFGVDEFITIADNLAEIEATFESIEEGSGAVLHKFITEARATMI
jgi:phytoene desaturase